MNNIKPLKYYNSFEKRMNRYALNINELLTKMYNCDSFKSTRIITGNVETIILSDIDNKMLLRMEQNQNFISIHEPKSDVTFDLRFSQKDKENDDTERYIIIHSFGQESELVYNIEREHQESGVIDYIDSVECTYRDKSQVFHVLEIKTGSDDEQEVQDDIDENIFNKFNEFLTNSLDGEEIQIDFDEEELKDPDEEEEDEEQEENPEIETPEFVIRYYKNGNIIPLTRKQIKEKTSLYTDTMFSNIHGDLENRVEEYKNLQKAVRVLERKVTKSIESTDTER